MLKKRLKRPRGSQADKNFIGVTKKLLAVLRYFASEGSQQAPVSFRTLCKALPFARTTVHRLVYSLEQLGYLEKAETSEPTAHYRLGPEFFKLTESAVPFRRLQAVARTVMTNLLVRFGETVNLGVLNEGQVLYIDVLQSPSALRLAANPGQRNPMHCTALGKAILAFLSEEGIESIIQARPLIKMTAKTITRKADLRSHLASVREQGTALDLEENLDGAVCVAAPIFDQLGRVVAGVSVSGPANRMQPRLARIREELRQAGLEISSMMGAKAKEGGGIATGLTEDSSPEGSVARNPE